MASSVVLAAEAVARAHHARYDPSHDFYHITRVRGLALVIARSLAPQQQPDPVVVELAALFHDLLDKKYLPEPIPTAREHLAPFWDKHGGTDVSDEQRRLVERIVENVSYSKEVKRIAAGQQTEWHLTCPELHCVQDADKLDAIGAFGIMRCAAFSAISNRPLYLPPTLAAAAPVNGSPSPSPAASAPAPPSSAGDSAIDHFHDKLFKLEGMMKTARGRELARRRTESMRRFVEDTEREWREAEESFVESR
ncbi:HD domain-containing protein [Rhodotorula paludigena]|uniref:HD domain-containing protein n=1 Tax=Rhodotorula paludigena TaxID=86838 RepID=UPI00317813AA